MFSIVFDLTKVSPALYLYRSDAGDKKLWQVGMKGHGNVI